MNSTGQVTTFVLDSIVKIFDADFEHRFRPVFEDAVRMRGGLPSEPVFEVFNAFDHFSLACKYARYADEPGRAGNEVEEARNRALTNLGQARRHLAFARFFCVEHQILYMIERTQKYAANLVPRVRASKKNYQPTLDELEARFRKAIDISTEPIYDPEELREEVEKLDKETDALTAIQDELMEVILEILGPDAAASISRAS